ncbi:ferritin-like domain-containing protein [Arachidicoccus sp.]|uniref:YciE/YciF ferroxidase family protein n=1 Tax=Arachidicoccus sp. TaxID=1872624 RepID=UPI003D1F512F
MEKEQTKKAKGKVSEKMANSKFHSLFVDNLKDIYWAEKHLVKELPKMSASATSNVLKECIDDHLEETKEHVSRLEKAFEHLGLEPEAKKCEAMAGLVKEAHELIDETQDDSMVRDCGIILAAQKVEHYEIATYGSLAAWAQKMKHNNVAKLLLSTLEEEKNVDEKLTEIADDDVNEQGAEE